MYDKLERLREYISDLEIEAKDKNFIEDLIEDIERDLEIRESTIEYLNDEDYNTDINSLILFNKDGYITEISNFNHSGNLSKKSVYVFDGDGKVTKINK